MYIPAHFEETRVDELTNLISAFPLGVLVVNGPGGLDANHLPFEVESSERPRLIAHIARANPLAREIGEGTEALVIFRAGDAYVSPNWYPSKAETDRHVPTWNYRVVHVHGTLRLRDDERFVRGIVARLTRTHEGRTGDERPWKMGDSAPDYIDSMLARIVGIEVEVSRILGKWKLSQNREDRDRINVAYELDKRDAHDLAAAMLAVAKQ